MIAADTLYPYLLEPTLTPAIWGGRALVRTYNKHGDPAATLGESWECWDANRVRDGALAGLTLGDVRARLGRDLTGPIDPARIFPVLTKLIDAHAPLSVQVHPDDAYAQRVEGQPNGKTECWYVLDADPGAEIVLGWTRDTSRDEYLQRVADGTLGEILRRVPARTGDVFFLPAGTVHAIGAGIRLFETQQASDLTYRMFDWNRVGADGRARELHVQKAADVLDYRATFPSAIRPLVFREGGVQRALLVADPRFLVEKITIVDDGAQLTTDGRPLTLTAMAADLTIDVGPAGMLVPPWGTVVTPAITDRITIAPATVPKDVLVVRPQPDLERARDAVRRADVPDRTADAWFGGFASGT